MTTGVSNCAWKMCHLCLLCVILQTAELMRRYADKRMQEEQEMRDLVQQVAEGHKNSKAAKEKLQKLKQNIGMPPRYKSLTVFFPDHHSSFPCIFFSQ